MCGLSRMFGSPWEGCGAASVPPPKLSTPAAITCPERGACSSAAQGHLSSLFQDQLNTTPQVFWSAMRVEEAVRRLVEQEEPLTSVALDLRFSNSGNFSRFFREHMGVTPSRFRRAASTSAPHLLTGIF